MRTLEPAQGICGRDGTGIEGPGAVEGIAFVPGRHLLVVGGTYGSVALVDADRGLVVKRLRGHATTGDYGGNVLANPIWTPGMSADGEVLATASKDGTVRLWSLPDWPRTGPRSAVPDGNAEAQLSPDGRWLSVYHSIADIVEDSLRSGTFGAVSA